MEKMIEMGFTEGFKMSMNNLENLLATLSQSTMKDTKITAILASKIVIFYMNVQEQIKKYITSQPEPKRSDMQELHRIILQVMPACKLWFLDGKNSENKTVSNPNIGYGSSHHKIC